MSDELEEIANMLGSFHPQWRADAQRMLEREKRGERTELRSLLGFRREVDRGIRANQSATQQFIDTTTAEVLPSGVINFDFIRIPKKNDVVTYPVSIVKHVPNVGFAIKDKFGNRETYWVSEKSIADPNKPTLQVKVLKADVSRMFVSVLPVRDLNRLLSSSRIQKGIKDKEVTVNKAPKAPEYPKLFMKPKVGMRVFVPAYLTYVDQDNGIISVVNSRGDYDEYSVSAKDVIRAGKSDDRHVKVRSTITGVSNDTLRVELDHPAGKYERTFPRNIDLEESLPPKPGDKEPTSFPELVNPRGGKAELPSAGSVVEYPVRVRQYLPGIGYLASDEYSQFRNYWITEDSISIDDPKLLALLLDEGGHTVTAAIYSPVTGERVTSPDAAKVPVVRKFNSRSLLNGLQCYQINTADKGTIKKQ